jgi:iron-sulfur cluster assembly protein
MIEVTNAARDEALRLLQQSDLGTEAFIRVGVKGGGCSGLMYDLDFDNTLKDDD